jgi:hypothetical protein
LDYHSGDAATILNSAGKSRKRHRAQISGTTNAIMALQQGALIEAD